MMSAEPEDSQIHAVRRVDVDLGARSYGIDIGPDLLARAGALVAAHLRRPKTAIVTDENVAHYHLETLRQSLADAGIDATAIIVPPGERSKCFATLADVCEQLLDAGIERQDAIIAFGGGVVGDLAGFAAAVLRRGVDFIQIPTSLLAQVDSSVGGKTGIDTPSGKNLIGAFHQPLYVLIDTDLLDTLPEREFRAGYAEVAKYGLIDDLAFYEWLEGAWPAIAAGDTQARMRAIETSCRAKAAIVSADEREHGARALLNLGHTFGHAFEAATGYSDRLLHGEGVAIGTVMAHAFSADLGLCERDVAERVANHFTAVGLPVDAGQIPGPLPGHDELLRVMYQDKKTVAGKLTFILSRGPGEAFIAHNVPENDVRTFLSSIPALR
jgi:3-dehydroquinate synthase